MKRFGDSMQKSVIALLTVGLTLELNTSVLRAQMTAPQPPSPAPTNTPDIYFINRAKNLARQAAISANGGLERYRPDPKMFGPAIQTQYVRNPDGSITFTFTGSAPGTSTPSVETVATVVPSGSVRLDYNGPLRNTGAGTLPPSLPVNIPVSPPSPSGQFSGTLPSPSLNPPAPPAPSPGTINPTTMPDAGGGDRTLRAWVDQDSFFSRARNLARQVAIKTNGGLERYRPEPSMFGPSSQSPGVKNANGSITFRFKGGVPGSAAMTTETIVTVNPGGSVNLDYNGPIR